MSSFIDLKSIPSVQIINILVLLLCFKEINANFGWCDPKLCPKNVRHVACKNNRQLSSACPADAIVIDVRPLKKLFVHEHNKLRSKIAMGYVPRYRPAAKMATMIWDDELAFLAELNVRKCDFEHDKCYNTYRFQTTGQCLAGEWSDPLYPLDMTRIITDSIGGWFSEHELIDMSYIDNFRIESNFEDYGHFTEMVVDRNTHVGCAAIRFTQRNQPDWHRVNIACNYASLHSFYHPVYEAGYPTSKCKTGSNPYYPGLCSVREKFNPNA